jgi:Uma2 family endonuclease
LSDSEPEPDVAVVSGDRDDYRDTHPTTALLVIEVAVTSADLDREKANLYAAAGIEEYLIVLPDQQSIEVHTQPTKSGYAQHDDFNAKDVLPLKSLPGLSLELNQLFR